jgi:hypothetical protein
MPLVDGGDRLGLVRIIRSLWFVSGDLLDEVCNGEAFGGSARRAPADAPAVLADGVRALDRGTTVRRSRTFGRPLFRRWLAWRQPTLSSRLRFPIALIGERAFPGGARFGRRGVRTVIITHRYNLPFPPTRTSVGADGFQS